MHTPEGMCSRLAAAAALSLLNSCACDLTSNDLDTAVCSATKEQTTSLNEPMRPTLDEALEYVVGDELVEVSNLGDPSSCWCCLCYAGPSCTTVVMLYCASALQYARAECDCIMLCSSCHVQHKWLACAHSC